MCLCLLDLPLPPIRHSRRQAGIQSVVLAKGENPELKTMRVTNIVIIQTLDPAALGTKSRAMPKDQQHMVVEIAVLADHNAVPTKSDFNSHITTGKMRFSLEFAEAERGKVGYIRSYWLTRTDKQSPISTPLRFDIL